MSQGVALLLLFVVLPIVLGVVVVRIVMARGPTLPPELRTSSLLADGEPAVGVLREWKVRGGFLDQRPMVAFRVSVGDRDMVITQSVPRPFLRDLERDSTVAVRLSPDGAAGAIDFSAAG